MDKKDKILNWFPLYVDKWLWGSTRIELRPDERSVFVDLLALAAKDDGHIRANNQTPYLHRQLAGMFLIDEELLTRTIIKCIEVDKITEEKDGIYYITNWSEYQFSDRWKRWLKKQKTGKIKDTSAKAEVPSAKAERKPYNTILNDTKLDETKLNNINPDTDFENFWNLYDKKVGKPNAIKEWNKLSTEEKQTVFVHMSEYCKVNERLYRKDPERYLKNKTFNDEIIQKESIKKSKFEWGND